MNVKTIAALFSAKFAGGPTEPFEIYGLKSGMTKRSIMSSQIAKHLWITSTLKSPDIKMLKI